MSIFEWPVARARNVGAAFWRALVLAALALGLAAPAAAQAPGGADQLGGQVAANGTTVSFRVFSANATRLEVNLYRQSYGAGQYAAQPRFRH
jgi:hypothetical protein